MLYIIGSSFHYNSSLKSMISVLRAAGCRRVTDVGMNE